MIHMIDQTSAQLITLVLFTAVYYASVATFSGNPYVMASQRCFTIFSETITCV